MKYLKPYNSIDPIAFEEVFQTLTDDSDIFVSVKKVKANVVNFFSDEKVHRDSNAEKDCDIPRASSIYDADCIRVDIRKPYRSENGFMSTSSVMNKQEGIMDMNEIKDTILSDINYIEDVFKMRIVQIYALRFKPYAWDDYPKDIYYKSFSALLNDTTNRNRIIAMSLFFK